MPPGRVIIENWLGKWQDKEILSVESTSSIAFVVECVQTPTLHSFPNHHDLEHIHWIQSMY